MALLVVNWILFLVVLRPTIAKAKVAVVPIVGAPLQLDETGSTQWSALRGSSTPLPPFGHPSASTSYPQYDGFSLFLVEEFDEPIDLDTDPIWTWSDGGLLEGQVRFTRENIIFKDGKMQIEVRNNSATADPQPQSCSHAEAGPVPQMPFTSGEMRTRYNMFRYGIYEVRMRAPEVQPGNATINGNYISTMFVYRDGKFKHWREIDIEVTGDSPRSVTMNVLYAENTEGWNPDIQSTKNYEAPENVDVRVNFHTLAFAWLPSGISWYFDGKLVASHGKNSGLPVPELPGKIAMNLWIFNWLYGFGGPEGKNNRYPMRNEYDWIRFYKWVGDSKYPCADMSTSCLDADDHYLSGNNPCDSIPQMGTRNGHTVCSSSCL